MAIGSIVPELEIGWWLTLHSFENLLDGSAVVGKEAVPETVSGEFPVLGAVDEQLEAKPCLRRAVSKVGV